MAEANMAKQMMAISHHKDNAFSCQDMRQNLSETKYESADHQSILKTPKHKCLGKNMSLSLVWTILVDSLCWRWTLFHCCLLTRNNLSEISKFIFFLTWRNKGKFQSAVKHWRVNTTAKFNSSFSEIFCPYSLKAVVILENDVRFISHYAKLEECPSLISQKISADK